MSEEFRQTCFVTVFLTHTLRFAWVRQSVVPRTSSELRSSLFLVRDVRFPPSLLGELRSQHRCDLARNLRKLGCLRYARLRPTNLRFVPQGLHDGLHHSCPDV